MVVVVGVGVHCFLIGGSEGECCGLVWLPCVVL